jgi:hypothetical protein
MHGMKKMLMMIAVICLIGFIACKKDKKTEYSVDKNYFTIEKATFTNSAFPAASAGNAPSITSVVGNSSILEGGSNPISITTSSTVKEVLVGVQGRNGYYKIESTDLKATTQTYLIFLLFSQIFEMDNFTILIAIVDNAGLISEHQFINVSRITAGTGKLQISCSWDKPNDLDLHLVEPNLNEIYWDSTMSVSGGVLDVDSNPVCYLDYINSENITYSGNAKIAAGKYIVRISLFESCQVIDVTNYVVTARLDGNLITPTTGKNPFYGTVNASDCYIGGTGPREGKTVMEFNVASAKSALVEKQKMLQFSYQRKINLLKRSMVTR